MAKPSFWKIARKKPVFLRWRIILLVVLGLIFSSGLSLVLSSSRLMAQNPSLPIGELFYASTPVSSTNEGVQVPSNTEQLIQKGKVLYQVGQFAEAAQSFQQSARVYESQKDTFNQALALNYLSLTEQKLGQWEQASRTIATSLNLLERSKLNTRDTKHILALALNTQGSLQLALGQAEKALESWQKASNIYNELNDAAGKTGSLINQATAFQSLGLYRRTIRIFEQIEKNLLSTPDSLVKISGLRSFGNVLLASGDIDKSQKVLEQSLALAQQLPASQAESSILLSLGNAAFARGNRNLLRDTIDTEDNFLPSNCRQGTIARSDRPWRKPYPAYRTSNSSQKENRVASTQTDPAKAYYTKAIDYYQKSANTSTSTLTAAQARLNRLKVLQSLQEQPTNEDLQAIQSSLSNLTPSRGAVYARVNFAQSLICLVHRDRETIQLLNTAVQQARDLKDIRAESYSLGYLGQFYEIAKQWTQAQQYTESALNLAQTIDAPDIAYQWQWQLGRLLLDRGDIKGAVTAYTTAVETLKSIRSDLVALNSDVQFDFRDEVEPIYRQLVALLLQPSQITSAKTGVKAEVSQENLKQARDAIETLQLAELDNFFRDACITVKPTQIDEVVDNTNPPTAIFYSIILADRIETIVKLPLSKELRHYTTDKPKAEVENTLEALRQKLEQRYTFRDREELSQEVYNWIIKPAIADLEKSKVKNLVFVLDGSLRNIPMGALYDGKQYLIEKYSIALSPGLQLLAPNPKRERFQALTAGLTTSRLDFSPLPNVATELEQIAAVIPSKKLVNQDFTDTSIENQVGSASYGVVHLATHGRFSSQLEETFILAWNGKINIKELREVLQTREQVLRRSSRVPPPIELLVLSACETATGDKRAALGLAGVAVRSGARSTLASLWQVDDKSTSMLMSQFYRQLTLDPKITKAEALRRAQLFVLQDKGHPFYWAPYVLVGNWL
ncbi:CHAT domain-containing protein [Scytonema sp. NUACC26]|uniref:CHAT domain-containing protein n=1 Tax=Scytonema sp. NUACC26 TaxID=3140176 RepID=UPI0034DB9266